jgi:glycosyltransferase involved in cell wall biosynthesis
MRLGILASHPIQYHAPWFRELARRLDLHVYFSHRQTPAQQGAAGYGVAFDWDVDLLGGYHHTFLPNTARLPDTGRFLGCDNPTLADEIASGRFDAFVVCGWNLKAYWQAVRACRDRGVPVLVRGDSQLETRRSVATRGIKQVVYRMALTQFDGFMAVGTRNMQYLMTYGVPDERVFHVPHCIDVARFRSSTSRTPDEREAARAALGCSPADLVCMFVGRFVDWKHPEDVLLACQQVHKQSGQPIHAVFVGAGPEEGRLRALATKTDVPVTFMGFRNQTELPRIYGMADVLVLPSDAQETWGLVVNEAMACGVPAVVSDAAGCAPDMVVPGRTGELYPTGDTGALADALKRVTAYAHSPSTLTALHEISERHDCSAAADATVHAVHTVLSRKHRAGVG